MAVHSNERLAPDQDATVLDRVLRSLARSIALDGINARILEYLDVALQCRFGLTMHASGEHQTWSNGAPRLRTPTHHDLPRYAEAILNPAVAPAPGILPERHECLPTVGEFRKQAIGILDSIDKHEKRDARVDGEDRSAVERGETLTCHLELDSKDAAARLAAWVVAGFRITRGCYDAATRECASVEIGSRFGLIVKPEARYDGALSHCLAVHLSLLVVHGFLAFL